MARIGGRPRAAALALVLLLVTVLPAARSLGITTTTTGVTGTANLPGMDLLNVITQLLSGNVNIGTDVNEGVIGGVAGSMALLAAALKAPLVALYQISAEVVVMVALILFISYIASLLGIDDFRRRTGLSDDAVIDKADNKGFLASIWESEMFQGLTHKVYDAIENFDKEEFLQRIDTRH